jgi:hypothetical protein
MYRERDPNALVKVKSNKPTAAANRAAGDRLPSERAAAGDAAARTTARTRARPPQGQGPQRRGAVDGGNAGAVGRRTRAAHEDARPTRMEPLPGGNRTARQPQEPGARHRPPQDPGARPRQPRAPRADEGGRRRRAEPRADGPVGDPRPRRAPRADDPRRANGADRPRRTQGRHGENPPPRGRPWDYED